MTLSLRLDGVAAGWGTSVCAVADLFIDFSEMNACLPIVGRTGRGKSTLMHVISGMLPPIAGRLEWTFPDGETLEWSATDGRAAERARLRRFGVLLQDSALPEFLTIGESIRNILALRGLGGDPHFGPAHVRSRVADMCIESEDPDRMAAAYPRALSGGQRQRMALAAAIAHDPTVLFADEPTGSLDEVTRHRLLAVIRRWLDHGDGTRGLVFITHQLSEPAILEAPQTISVVEPPERGVPSICLRFGTENLDMASLSHPGGAAA